MITQTSHWRSLNNIMDFAEYLSALINAKGLSKNKIIKETKVDRSSFFQFLKGARRPTGKQLLAISQAAGFSDEEKDRLHELYVKDKYGKNTFLIWKMIRDSIAGIDTYIPAPHKDSPVTGYLRQIFENAGSSPVRLDFFMPVSSYVRDNLFDELSSLPKLSSGSIAVRMIIVGFSDHDIAELKLISFFMQSIQLYKNPRLELELYYYEGNYNRTDIPLIGYPFFILSRHSILMINDLSNDCKKIDDPGFLLKYTESFQSFLKKCDLLSRGYENPVNYTDYLASTFPVSDDDFLYILESRPCVCSIVPMDMVEKYTPPALSGMAKPWITFVQTLLHMKSYHTLDGFRSFREDGMLYDAGLDIRIDDGDTEKLCGLILDNVGSTMFFLDSSRFYIPDQWHICSGRKSLFFINRVQQNTVISSLNPQVCGAFYQYFSHLDEDRAELLSETAFDRLSEL